MPRTQSSKVTSSSFWDHPITTIEEAISLRKQIGSLQQRLDSIVGRTGTSANASTARPASGASTLKGRKLSPETLGKMRAAQQARWTKSRETSDTSAIPASVGSTGGKAKRILSPQARDKMAAAQEARWSKQEKSGELIVRSEMIKLPKKGGGMTPEQRARISAALKARWTAKKKGEAAAKTS